MEYKVITNYNFKTIEDFVGLKPEGLSRDYGYTRIGDDIVFEANFVACPCIYYKKQNNLFAFSFDCDLVVDFCKKEGIPLTDTFDNLNDINPNIRKHIKSSIIKRYKYNLDYIEGWSKVTLHKDGTFDIVKSTFEPFEYEIWDEYDKFKAFLLKYKKLACGFADSGRLIPTITGGLDSRALIGLYREKVDKIDKYFLTAIKQDGKNNVEQGQLELKIAEQVARKIGIGTNRVEFLDNGDSEYITITGMFNENALECKDPNDPEYIYKIIQHGWANKYQYQYINKLTPYMDDDYLKFKQHGELTRMLLLLLLVPDLLHIPFISGASLFNHFPDGCLAGSLLIEQLSMAQQILDSWGEHKVKTLLVE